jgi:peptidoglycan/LPS O-acetylase OafA/YrhL
LLSVEAPRSVGATSRRDEVVHILRGVAALLVCCAHISIAGKVPFPPPVVAFFNRADFGVALFFMISGFVVPWSLMDRGYSLRRFPRFLARRLVRLDPPYFAALAVGLAVLWVKSTRMIEPFPPTSVIALHFGYLAGLADRPWIVPVFWTLAIEFQFYVLIGLSFPLLERAVRRSLGDAASTFGWGIALALLADWGIHYARDVPVPGGSASVWLYYAPYFVLGFAVFAARTKAAHWILPAWVALLMWWFSATTLGVWVVISAIATLLAAFPTPRVGNGMLWNALRGLGTISYSLYLTHVLVVGKLSYGYVAVRPGPVGSGMAFVLFVADIVLAIGAAALFYWMFERPAHRWSRRIAV